MKTSINLTRRQVLQVSAVTGAALLLPQIVHAQEPAPSPSTSPAPDPGLSAGVRSTIAPDASANFQKVVQAVLDSMEKTGVPGASLGILYNGHEEYATFGVKNLATADPVTQDSLFAIGSITKTMTAAALMQLVDSGKLDLNATVRTYLPKFQVQDADAAARVTVKQLLTHVSGWWGDYFVDTGNDDDSVARYVDEVMPTLPQISPLGRLFSYNNAAVIAAGRILEVISGLPYRTAMQQMVLDPLGMRTSTFKYSEVLNRPHADGYGLDVQQKHRLQDPQDIPGASNPTGGLWSTPRELLAYARFQMGDGTFGGRRILSASALEAMHILQGPRLTDGPFPMEIGLTWFAVTVNGLRLLEYAGGTFGQDSLLVIAPERGFAFAMLTNSDIGGESETAASNTALKTYLGLSGTPAARSAPASPKPSPSDLAEYVGFYRAPSQWFSVQAKGDQLFAETATMAVAGSVDPKVALPAQFPLTPLSMDQVDLGVMEGVGPIHFFRQDDGHIGWVEVGQRALKRVSDF